LERLFAEELGVKHAIAFNSGATAQHAALAACDIGPGDEVIVPPLTFISTAYTVLIQNAVPVFADVDPGTFNLDPAQVRLKITPRTRAVVPVHWFGHAVEMDELLDVAREHQLRVIEDCAHGYRGRYKGQNLGTIGDLSCWSLQQSKVITSAGEGGMVATDDDGLAQKVWSVRSHGKRFQKAAAAGQRLAEPYRVAHIGNNYRMGELHAAFALAQLRRLDELHQRRREFSLYLRERLKDVTGLRLQDNRPGVDSAFAYFPVCFDRDHFSQGIEQISQALTAEGVNNLAMAREEISHVHPLFTKKVGYPNVGCPYRCPHYEGQVEYGFGTLPVAERIAEELLILPLHPALDRRDLDDIVKAVDKLAAAYS
jgi:dTDP-4-amino-4,6-dideoxygalactose transaminase